MNSVVAKALFKAHSYSEYRTIVTNLALEGKSTCADQTEELTNYSILNQARMNRLDKTIMITEENKLKLHGLNKQYIWLVLAEGWCGDVAQILPILNKLAIESNKKIELKIVLRDENEDLMKFVLTDGAKAIPKLLIIDWETALVVDFWGPRPKGATDLIKNYKAQHGTIDEQAKTDLQLWYLNDKGYSTQDELINLTVALD